LNYHHSTFKVKSSEACSTSSSVSNGSQAIEYPLPFDWTSGVYFLLRLPHLLLQRPHNTPGLLSSTRYFTDSPSLPQTIAVKPNRFFFTSSRSIDDMGSTKS